MNDRNKRNGEKGKSYWLDKDVMEVSEKGKKVNDTRTR